MRIIAVLLLGLSLGGCVPLVIGGVVGYDVAVHRQRCMVYFGNPYCRVGYGEHHAFPMGIHR